MVLREGGVPFLGDEFGDRLDGLSDFFVKCVKLEEFQFNFSFKHLFII
jgi:hypothetical protein